MIECLIIGDSIAVGISHYRTDCTVEAKVGIDSEDYVNGLFRHFDLVKAKKTIISLGSNDGLADSYSPLLALRELITGEVIWVLSSNNIESRYAALTIAKKYGDSVLDIRSYPLRKDLIHPTNKGYKLIAEDLK
jgi:lysophospholipase L1-like esterase